MQATRVAAELPPSVQHIVVTFAHPLLSLHHRYSGTADTPTTSLRAVRESSRGRRFTVRLPDLRIDVDRSVGH